MDTRAVEKNETLAERARAHPIAAAAIIVALGSAAALLGAWFFQYALGLKPCPLCYEQRYPYYFAIPLAAMVVMGDRIGSQRRVLLAGIAALAALMLWDAGLAAYHAGVEWKWWLGPRDCSGSLGPGGGGNLLKDLRSIHVVRCDEAAWRFLGISLAGYNALWALTLAAVAGWGFMAAWRKQS